MLRALVNLMNVVNDIGDIDLKQKVAFLPRAVKLVTQICLNSI